MKGILRLLATGVALWLTTLFFPAASFDSWWSLAGAAGALWIINFAVRPILKVLTIPITCLTFGLFLLVVNAFCVWLAVYLIPGITFGGSFWAYLTASVLTSIVSGMLVTGEK